MREDGRLLASASARAATWLIRFQRTALDGDVQRVELEAATARRAGAELLAAFPDRLSRETPLFERVAERLQAANGPLVPSHGGYHPENVLLSRRATTVIDFDKFALREAAHDVGYAIGRLLLLSYLASGRLGPGARAATAFWHAYAEGGAAPWSRVAVQAARFLLQSLHFDLCVLRNGRGDLLELWPLVMRRLLAGEGPAALARMASLASTRPESARAQRITRCGAWNASAWERWSRLPDGN